VTQFYGPLSAVNVKLKSFCISASINITLLTRLEKSFWAFSLHYFDTVRRRYFIIALLQIYCKDFW